MSTSDGSARKIRGLRVVALILPWLLWRETPVHAYLDPGNGSMLVQLLLGGLAGAAVLLRLSWRRLMAVLGVKRDNTPPASR